MAATRVSIDRATLDAGRAGLARVSTGRMLPPVTPGEVLRAEFLEPLALSARALARDLGVPANRVTAIVNGTRARRSAVSAVIARRFGVSAEFWMNLQTAHDLEIARRAGAVAAAQ